MAEPSKRKAVRRASAHYYITAEEHVVNEVKHERLLTETSKLSSSWASLRVSGTDRQYFEELSSPSSANSSPAVHRPSSFSGPLVISVTCSTSSNTQSTNYTVPLSPNQTVATSCHPSPCASPVSSKVQCYSPGLGVKSLAAKKTSVCYSNGGASPLLVSSAQKRKRTLPNWNSVGGSSAEHSRESSPDPPVGLHKIPKQNQLDTIDINSYRWPPNSPCSSNHGGLFNAPSSPSTMSLPSPRLSTSSVSNNNPNSPASSLLIASNLGSNNNHIGSYSELDFNSNSNGLNFLIWTQNAKARINNSAEKAESIPGLTVKPILDEDSNSNLDSSILLSDDVTSQGDTA